MRHAPALPCDFRHHLCARRHIEATHDRRDMRLDGGFGNFQFPRNDLVRHTFDQQTQHLGLPRRQVHVFQRGRPRHGRPRRQYGHRHVDAALKHPLSRQPASRRPSESWADDQPHPRPGRVERCRAGRRPTSLPDACRRLRASWRSRPGRRHRAKEGPAATDQRHCADSARRGRLADRRPARPAPRGKHGP